MAARRVSRDELELIIQEINRGEVERDELEDLIASLELTVPDEQALELLDDTTLSAKEIAAELVPTPGQDL